MSRRKPKRGQWYGPRFAKAMKAANVSEVQVAAAAEVKDPKTVRNWCKHFDEVGASEPRTSQLLPIARITGVTVDYLLGLVAA